MKILSVALLLLASMALVLLGCSDNSAVPVSPADQSAQVPASLQKSPSPSAFTATMFPTGLIGQPVTKYPDGKVMIRGIRQPVVVLADFNGSPDLLSGVGEVEINGITDYVTGVGQWHGKLTISPASGGVWDFTWHGTATLNVADPVENSTWTLPLKEQGHGMGGALTGMQCRMVNTITASYEIDSWTGSAQGVVISH